MRSEVFRRLGQDFQLRKVKKILKQINALKGKMSSLSDQELVAKTVEFRQRLSEGESLDDILVEAFAVVREADKRILGMFPYDVQVMGAIVMHYGNVAEMNTGEGKTLTATMPVYLNAFSGEGVMVVTPNEYLSKRDAEEMGQVYRFLGLTIGVPFTEDPKKEMKAEEKKLIYASDIIYTTNSNLGFDYLNDNLASNEEGKFLRPFNYVIIDEIDDILLDSAQTPLIIAGSPRVQSNYYAIIDTLVTTLVEGEDYIFKEEKEEVWLTTKGAKSAENFLGIDNLYKEEHASFARHLVYAIRAHKLFTKDKDYIIRGNEMVLVDKGTGRLMEMTKLQGGLHQAIEAKEHVKLSPETRAMASITYQSLFKMFNKISGMTGTGKVAEKEFIETYNMSVVRIPTNRPRQRIDYPDNLYITLPEKVYASLEYIKEYHAKGNPLLVFVGSVEMSQLYSSLLFREGIAHNVLNANNAAREAQIISESGQMGAVTVATSMAGRGTDIKLGKGVAELGGLIVIGTERMESQRIDLQIRGRSGRQGDPGMSKFFVSLEDDVIKKFGPSWVHKKYKDYQVQDMTQPEVLKGRKYRKLVEKAQHASDSAGRSARRQTLEYAESMNIQRDMIYKERNRLIDGSRDLEDVVVDIIERYTEEVAADHYASRELLFHFIVTNISFHVKEVPDYIDVTDKTAVRSFMKQVIDKELSEKKELLNQHDLYEQFLRLSLLKAIDDNWVEQVDYLQQLSMAIGGQSASQKNPIVEYYQEAYAGFEAMKEQIRADMVRNLLMGLVEVTPKGEIVTHFP
ncbi:preprotein translocase subunit SecA [Streptococcus pneumoniae]|nr:preprotein translocase subunit SecA [Streptococcus pneumoniae]VMF24609.1 preprotein translocase subunit SecA [Streptococcus pneumoniae]